MTSVKLTFVSAFSVHSSGQRWLPGTTWRPPLSRSTMSSAIQAAMQVPGSTFR